MAKFEAGKVSSFRLHQKDTDLAEYLNSIDNSNAFILEALREHIKRVMGAEGLQANGSKDIDLSGLIEEMLGQMNQHLKQTIGPVKERLDQIETLVREAPRIAITEIRDKEAPIENNPMMNDQFEDVDEDVKAAMDLMTDFD